MKLDFTRIVYKEDRDAFFRMFYMNGATVSFVRFKEGELWYRTSFADFEFPVPTSKDEVGSAEFMASDKASLFLRYARKHMETLLAAHAEHHATMATLEQEEPA